MSSFLDIKDEERYSRQSYTIGKDVMGKISNSKILVIGYNCLGLEIIKNLCLLGISKIDLINDNNLTNKEINSMYYEYKSQLPLESFKKLNPTIELKELNIDINKINKELLINYTCIISNNLEIDNIMNLNNLCHQNNIGFINCNIFGLMGYVFNDFGNEFVIEDLDGDDIDQLFIEEINDKQIKFKDPHKLAEKETLLIDWDNGNKTEYIIKTTITPLIIELIEKPNQNKNEYIKIIRKKNTKIINNITFEELLNQDNKKFVISDFSVPFDRNEILLNLIIAIDKYKNKYNEYPRQWSLTDYDLLKEFLDDNENENNNLIYKKCSFTMNGSLLPLCSILGGIVCQELLKYLGKKYNPIDQIYFIDYFDLIDDNEIINFDDNKRLNYRLNSNNNFKYESLINIFGKKFLEKLQNVKPFIIGSGAIGCELIKNLGMLGIKNITITDPDHIEKSNLSRQFLFNDNDIYKNKAEVASEKIKNMNNDINITVYKNKVCKETEDIFNNNFHENIDIYLNALDNIDARIYMDQKSIKYRKPLIDSGTMGSKGNVQVIIPDITESYSSTKDPDDNNNIPICTLKSFPYKKEHTIQWARELFESEFTIIPELIEKYKNESELLKLNENEISLFYKQIIKYKNFVLNEEGYQKILDKIYNENFIENIKEILDKYENDKNSEELKEKKLPILLKSKEIYKNFIELGFIILNQIFQKNINFNGLITKKNKNIIIDDTENINELEQILSIINKIPNINKIDFDKDNDELKHVNWINLVSNIRNKQYFIEESTIYETRKIAGNIIPAMITTTSLISGFQILEFIKIIKYYETKDISKYKNRFVNLNINYCDGIEPGTIKKYKLDNNKEISLWTNFKTSYNKTNLIIDEIYNYTNKKIEFITCDNETVYDGDEINIDIINNKNSEILILLEDIPIGIPIYIK
jgi:ubiquitin-activating enzyme E1